jgi:hypothetical protein
MKFKLEIDCAHPTFRDPDAPEQNDMARNNEIARILRATADKIEAEAFLRVYLHDRDGVVVVGLAEFFPE